MNELTIIKRDGGAYIDSREVADAIGKRHDHLLRDIGNYLDIIENFSAPNFGGCDFFVESSYPDVRGRSRLRYLISKMGCEMIANKLIGEKGILFTYAYVRKFNELEQQERERHQKPRLNEFNSAVRNVLNGLNYCCAAPKRIIGFLNGVYKQIGIEVCDTDDYICDFYSVTDIAKSLKVYSKSGRPHGHAISAIIVKLNVSEKQTLIVPYGLVGLMVKYDWLVYQAVKGWLEENGKPRMIPHLNFNYHVNYGRQTTPYDSEDGEEIIDLDDDDDFEEFFTTGELDEMCGDYDDCDDCPGFYGCIEQD